MNALHIGRSADEVDRLQELLLAKVKSGTGSKVSSANDGGDELRLEVRQAFIRLQFADPMRNYTRWGGWYGAAFTVLSVAALVSGLASSGIAAGWSHAHWERWTILALGLIGAVAAVISQVWRPGQKSTSRTRGGNALRREGWEYLNSLGRYSELQNDDAFALFAAQIGSIVRAAEEVDEQPPPTRAVEPVSKDR